MNRTSVRRSGAIRRLVVAGLVATVLVVSSAIPALAGSSGTWTKTGSLNVARGEETATLLPNGQVLVAGGADYKWNGYASAELYNPLTGKWTFTGSMNSPRLYTRQRSCQWAGPCRRGVCELGQLAPARARQCRGVQPLDRHMEDYGQPKDWPLQSHGGLAPERQGSRRRGRDD